MRRRMVLTMALIGLVALAAMRVPSALAGGWATTTIDSLPKEVRAGQKITLGFVVLQHGQTRVNDFGGQRLKPYLVAIHAESKQQVRADAFQSGEIGHFVVEVTFPEAGDWTFKLVPHPFPDPTELGSDGEKAVIPLSVLPPAEPIAGIGEPTGDKDTAAVGEPLAGDPLAGDPLAGVAAPAAQTTAAPSGATSSGIWWASGGVLIVAAAVSVLIMRGGLRRKVAG